MVIVLLLILIVIILSIPSVQTYIANKVTTNLNETYGTDIHIDRMGLNWKAEVDIREVYIADHHNDTLIYAKQLQTDILSIQHIINGDLDFGAVDLDHAKFYVKTYKGEQDDNLYVFTEKFNTGAPSTEVFHLDANEVSLSNSHIKISDENEADQTILDLTKLNLKARRITFIQIH